MPDHISLITVGKRFSLSRFFRIRFIWLQIFCYNCIHHTHFFEIGFDNRIDLIIQIAMMSTIWRFYVKKRIILSKEYLSCCWQQWHQGCVRHTHSNRILPIDPPQPQSPATSSTPQLLNWSFCSILSVIEEFPLPLQHCLSTTRETLLCTWTPALAFD